MGTAAFTDGPSALDRALTMSNVDFEGEYVDLPIGSLINSLTDATFATWVEFSGRGNAWQRIFDFGSGTTQYVLMTPQSGGSTLRLRDRRRSSAL